MLEVELDFARGDFRLQLTQSFQNDICAVVGASGCGKSTLLALIAGLLKPRSGHIRLNGKTLVDTQAGIWLPPHRRRIGLVFQDRQLLPHLSVQQNLLYGYQQLQPAQRRFQLQEVVELLEIASLLKRKPLGLSGGEQQRVALGRALLYAPELLLLDEPLAALDERLKQQILPYLLRISRDLKLPMIYVTHSPSEVNYLTERVFTLGAGHLLP